MSTLGFDIQFEWLNLSIALLIFMVAVPSILYRSRQKSQAPKIRFSSLRNIAPIKKPLKVRLRRLPVWLRIAGLTLLLIAYAHPYQEKAINRQEAKGDKQESQVKKRQERKLIKVPTEGISIQLLIDHSGSMGIQTDRMGRSFNYMKFEDTLLSKLDVVRIISKRFIKGTKETSNLQDKKSLFTGRGNDLLSLTTFARYP